MNRIIVFIFSLLTLFNCSSSSKIIEPEIKQNQIPQYKPEIPIEILNKKGIVAINPKYKQNYFDLMPYFLYNENDVFNELQGDFNNVKFKETSNINIMVGYWNKYSEFKNTLVVYLALSKTSKLPLKDLPISVESSKNGNFRKVKLKNSGYNRIQQRALFVNELNLDNNHDILNKIRDDVITVNVDGQIYHFLNPEVELD